MWTSPSSSCTTCTSPSSVTPTRGSSRTTPLRFACSHRTQLSSLDSQCNYAASFLFPWESLGDHPQWVSFSRLWSLLWLLFSAFIPLAGLEERHLAHWKPAPKVPFQNKWKKSKGTLANPRSSGKWPTIMVYVCHHISLHSIPSDACWFCFQHRQHNTLSWLGEMYRWMCQTSTWI